MDLIIDNPSIILIQPDSNWAKIIIRCLATGNRKNDEFPYTNVEWIESPFDALQILMEKHYDICIVELKMFGIGALEIMSTARPFDVSPSKDIVETEILITAEQEQAEDVLEVMGMGAFDYQLRSEILPKNNIAFEDLARAVWSKVKRARKHQFLTLENIRLMKELEKLNQTLEQKVKERTANLNLRVKELETLNKLGDALSSSSLSMANLDKLLELIYTQSNNILSAPIFAIALYDEQKDEVNFSFCIDNGKRREWEQSSVIDNFIKKCLKEKKHKLAKLKFSNKKYSIILMPMIANEKAIGVILLGNNKIFTSDILKNTLRFLSTLASQAAITIDNARLYQEMIAKEKMEIQAQSAREIQQSMLPNVLPQLKGFEIAAFTRAAWEVGGDFYDFVQTNENTWGLVLGDVTGKGMGAALYMAAAIGIIKSSILAEPDSVKSTLNSINKNLRTKMKDSGNFVALTYALVDVETNQVIISNAAGNHPIYYSAENNDPQLLELTVIL